MDWKPQGYPSLSPYLICADPEAEIDFLRRAFGAVVLRRFDRPDGTVMHVELQVADGMVMLGGATADYPPAAMHLHLYVPEVAAVWDRAVAAGGQVVQDPQRRSAGDDLRGGLTDPAGVTWWIASQA